MFCMLLRPLGVGCLALAAALLIWRRTRWAAVGLGLTGVVFFALAAGTGGGVRPGNASGASGAERFTVAAFNAYGGRGDGHGTFAAWVLEERPDLVCIIEPPLRLSGEARAAWERYWAGAQVDRAGTIHIYSRRPFERVRFGGRERWARYKLFGPTSIELALPGVGPVVVWAVHLPSPRDATLWGYSLLMAEGLAKYLGAQWREAGKPAILLGDLNSPPTGRVYQTFVRRSGMTDAGAGLFRKGTWPARLPGWASLPIDHCFVSPPVRVRRYKVGPDVGSDHRPVLAELWIPRTAR